MNERTTIADDIYRTLRRDIIRLTITPGDTLSEAEVARQFGVSRQPVREAFIQLVDDGFLLVRPQRSTIVRPIAEEAVLSAQFIREAIEVAIVSDAARRWTAADARAMSALLAEQDVVARTFDRDRFHELDEAFHQELAERAGRAAAWHTVELHKAQLDRVRWLTVEYRAPRTVLQHREIADALAAHDEGAAVSAMRRHLTTIKDDLPPMRAKHPAYFAPVDAGKRLA